MECSVVASPPSASWASASVSPLSASGRAAPTFADPRWSLSLSCAACASTDVAGDPAALLAAYRR